VKEIKISEIMVPLKEYPTINGRASLYDAIMELDKARERPNHGKSEHRSLVVIDENGNVSGKLTYMDMLRGLEPKYGSIGDIKGMRRFGLSGEFVTFMRKHFGLWEGSFRDLCDKATKTMVKDVAEDLRSDLLIDNEGTIADAIHRMIVGGEVSLFVTVGDEIAGMIRLIDAFEAMGKEIMTCRL
jgi:hypothetical protein